jgi:aminoglycoside phosphotransferase (APT) family kinase protein
MPPSHAELQASPDGKTLAAVAEAVMPGASVASVRRLDGGLDNGMHVLELTGPSASRRYIVLRRIGGHGGSPAEKAFREWHTLNLLQQIGVPAPTPLLLDADGAVAGSPAIVTSFEDGRPLPRPSEAPDWTGQVAVALWKLHTAAVDQLDLTFLGPAETINELADRRVEDHGRFGGHPLGARLRAAIREAATDVSPSPVAITHGDFWPGNILWRDNRLLSIVDWSDARLTGPAMDAGYMWMDLAIVGETDAAREFTERYEGLSGGGVPNLRLARLLALSRALPDPAMWMPSWVGSGRADLDVEDVRRNFGSSIEAITG